MVQRAVVVAVVGLVAGLLVSGCSVTRRIAVGQMVPILENATASARESSDLQLIEQAFPANLLLVDGLIRTSPRNAELLTLGSFLYFGYALGFVEPQDPERAAHYFERGRDYGLRALERKRDFRRRREGTLEEYVKGLRSLGRRDVPAMAWAAANWGRWISLNLESPAAIAQQPRFEALVERLLEVEPDYEDGLPYVIRGMYDALRPEMFGGKPQRARAQFERAFQLSARRSLLYLVFYAEFYCRQILDAECFAATLQEVAAAPLEPPRFRLMNSLAKRRAARLLALQDELF